MGHSYEDSKKIVLKTILILGVITLIEVLIALTGKGYIIEGFPVSAYLMGFLMITLSMYKAYLIVFEFMHMKYETAGLVRSVLLPTLLLIWAIIAFLWEGDTWKERRIKDSTPVELTVPVSDHPQKSETDLEDHKNEEEPDHTEEEDH